MKRLMLETTTQTEWGLTRSDARPISAHPTSRIGQYFFPGGKEGEFGQVVQMEIIFTDGMTKKYYVEEVE